MIHDQDIPMTLWEDASSKIIYVQNVIPHYILGDKTPKEDFTSVNLGSVSRGYLIAQFTFMYPRKIDRRWNLLERRENLWDIVRIQSLFGSTTLVRDKLRLVRMLSLMRRQPSGDLDSLMQRSTVRSRRIVEIQISLHQTFILQMFNGGSN